MSLNRSKIRRKFMLNGSEVWVSAHTEQEYAEKILALSSGKASSQKHNFQEYAEDWFFTFSAPNIERSTAVTYERQLHNHILPVLASFDLKDITPANVQEVFNRMGSAAKQDTKNKVKTVLNQILEKALDDGYLQRNPLRSKSLRIKGVSAVRTEPYSIDQMRYLASHLSDLALPRDRAWLALSISLPLRPEEVLGLLWKNVDEANRILYVRNTVTHPDRNQPEFKTYTKTEASARDLVLSEEIMSYLPPRGNPDGFVIGGEHPLSYTQIRKMRKRIAEQLNFDDVITPRRFRTTVATDISAMTHDLKLVQKTLGHSTPQMTLKHYDQGRSTAIDAASAIQMCYGITKS